MVNKYKGLILFLIALIIAGMGYFFYKNNLLQGTQVLSLKGMPKGMSKNSSQSDFLFETINHYTIKIDVEDKIFKIKGMEDKIIFLKVFGWDCKYCQKEIPELINLKKQLGDSFEIIAIEAQQYSNEESLAYIKKYGINYQIVSGSTHEDFYVYLQEKYGWTGVIPLTIVLAKGGKVLAFEIGAKSYSLSELMKASLIRN